jgi:hypothetical protein
MREEREEFSELRRVEDPTQEKTEVFDLQWPSDPTQEKTEVFNLQWPSTETPKEIRVWYHRTVPARPGGHPANGYHP